MFYKLNVDNEYTLSPHKKNYVVLGINLPPLYKNSIGIKKQKYEDLISLKKLMPQNNWPFFEQLSFYNKK